ncbi:plasmid stabilization protein StbC [Lonsdalea quercina]|uniref:plasmid stabilization protein StbC n=1 Tax=Lonsdalea quercina TaxID=71657 RepID=UPI0039758EDA
MEKQPDKLDILMDWFLGDAKEITSKLESVTASVAETVERLDKTSNEINKSSEAAKVEVIASQRELVNTLKKEQKVSDQFFERLAGAQAKYSQTLIRQILIITVVCSFIGGAFGAAAITLLFH